MLLGTNFACAAAAKNDWGPIKSDCLQNKIKQQADYRRQNVLKTEMIFYILQRECRS